MSDFSKKIIVLRKNNDLTQKQLAINLEVSERNYQRLESGNTVPTVETLIKLANYFNVSADYLLGLSDDPTRH